MDILKSHISESEKQLEKRVNRGLAEFFETEPVEINVILHESKDSLDKLWKNADYKNKKTSSRLACCLCDLWNRFTYFGSRYYAERARKDRIFTISKNIKTRDFTFVYRRY